MCARERIETGTVEPTKAVVDPLFGWRPSPRLETELKNS
jgi:hypothetical protein